MRRLLWAFLALLALPCALPIDVPADVACCPGHNVLLNARCMDYELQWLTEQDRLAAEPARPDVLAAPSAKRRRVQMTCEEGMFLIEPWKESNGEDLYIDQDDRLSIGDDGVLGEKGKFCIANKIEVNKSLDIRTVDVLALPKNQVALVCFASTEETFLTATLSGTLALVSVGFLVLTLLVYIIVPELRDLQGKCMMCTALCLGFGFFHLSMAQLFLIKDDTFCVINGFLIFFWMLSAFVWMNVVSINVMRAAVFRTSNMSEKKTFWAYSAYGWGFPLIFLLAGVIAENTEGDHHKPGIGKNSCWFSGKVETWIYFYGPVAVLILCNIFLFFVTSIHLWKQTSYENVTKVKSLRYKFLLYLKIFLVMGLSWIFEIISFVHDTRHIVWLMIDTFNCLQGLVFFLVLVLLRKRALRGLAARGLRLPCCRLAHTGPDEECDEIVIHEEEAPALTTFS